jgi:hypothetical protein
LLRRESFFAVAASYGRAEAFASDNWRLIMASHTAFYKKNIGSLQQVARIATGLGMAVAAFVYLSGVAVVLGIASGLGLALTGVVGYCPACAMLGIGREEAK